jgi:hypothetical protein
MVRTKADNCSKKAVAAKAPRKVLGAPSGSPRSSSGGLSSPSTSKVAKYAGGNPVCTRPTPDWQKGISTFLKKLPLKENNEAVTADGTPVETESNEDAAAASSQSSWLSSAGCDEQTVPSQRNGIIDSDED